MAASRRQQHGRRSLSRAPAVLQERITHTLRRRKHSQSPDYSVVNPFVKYFLFGINFLFMYHFTLSIFLILEVIVVIFVFIFYFVDGAFANIGLYPEDAFKDAVKNYRDDPDTQSFIDNIQKILSCCGTSNDNYGYLDWNMNPYFNCSDGNDSPEACSVPFSCCQISEGDQKNYRCGAGALNKKRSVNMTINNEGCLKGLQNVIKDNIWIVGGAILGILIPQAMFICCAKALLSQIYEQMSKW